VDAAQLEAFGLDPDVLHLNHGAFGVAPVVVRRAAAAWRERAERNPHRFNRVEIGGLVAAARERAAGFLGVEPSLKCARKSLGGMSRTRPRLRPRSERGHNGLYRTEENMMAKYLLLKHYRGAPASVNGVPMDQWTPEELSAHVQYMQDFAARLEGTGEFVDSQALSPEGTFVRYDGDGRPPVTDGPFAETKDLIAGWMVIDVETYERALELAGELSAAPGAGGKPIHEWLEVRPFLAEPPTITE
jgi:hypothetical protein